eukprot:1183543-Prorocentrum_minimum.AAC.4
MFGSAEIWVVRHWTPSSAHAARESARRVRLLSSPLSSSCGRRTLRCSERESLFQNSKLMRDTLSSGYAATSSSASTGCVVSAAPAGCAGIVRSREKALWATARVSYMAAGPEAQGKALWATARVSYMAAGPEAQGKALWATARVSYMAAGPEVQAVVGWDHLTASLQYRMRQQGFVMISNKTTGLRYDIQ